MKTMVKGEIIFEWKLHPHKVDIACLVMNRTDTNPKYEELHTFSFPIDKEVRIVSSQENSDAYTSYLRDFINGWAKSLGILSSNPFLGYEITYREFGGEYTFRIYQQIDFKEMANSLWIVFIRDLSKHMAEYKTESVRITIDWPTFYSETAKKPVMDKFTVRIDYDFLSAIEEISIKGKPLSVPPVRSILASIAEENWPFEHKQELQRSIRYTIKELEPIHIISMKGRVRNSRMFVKNLIQEYKQFGKNPKKFLDRYKPEGITSLTRLMKGEQKDS